MSDLYDDLGKVLHVIKTQGWTRSRLISWISGRKSPQLNCIGGMCMTGAAGVGVEGERFRKWVWDTGDKHAHGFDWSHRGKAVLHALADNVPPEFKDEFMEKPRYSGIISAIEKIIRYNDRKLIDKSQAVYWVNYAMACVKETEKAPEPELTKQAPKVQHVKAQKSTTKEQIEKELA